MSDESHPIEVLPLLSQIGYAYRLLVEENERLRAENKMLADERDRRALPPAIREHFAKITQLIRELDTPQVEVPAPDDIVIDEDGFPLAQDVFESDPAPVIPECEHGYVVGHYVWVDGQKTWCAGPT